MLFVIPAKAGTHALKRSTQVIYFLDLRTMRAWVLAFAGMTGNKEGRPRPPDHHTQAEQLSWRLIRAYPKQSR